MTLQELIIQAQNLPRLKRHEALFYQNHLDVLVDLVDVRLTSLENISRLIGHNPLQIMYDNHQHHARFMATVFVVNDYSLLAKTLPWVYRSYRAHHFSYDYFIAELEAWIQALRDVFPETMAATIIRIYEWMIGVHHHVIDLGQSEHLFRPPHNADYLDDKNIFLEALLLGDSQACLQLARKYIDSIADLDIFYLYILQAAMFNIGVMWEKAEITIAQEHLASTIVNRLMAQVALDISPGNQHMGSAVVSTSPNEYHQLGALMVADVLDFDGWEVHFVGADVPHEELIAFVKDKAPDFFALSVTIPFNLARAQAIIEALRADPAMQSMKIMVGGRAFIDNPTIWYQIGADGYAANIIEARELGRKWRNTE